MAITTKIANRLWTAPRAAMEWMLWRGGVLPFIDETRATQTPITFSMWFDQQIRGINKGPYWPVHRSSIVTNWRNILAGIETSPGYMPGCYIQGIGQIEIGDYTQIAPQVGIISANHAQHDLREHEPEKVTIGRYCWLGMGSIILPGVTLGDFTVVAAGAVVTQSFPEGYQMLAGTPAQFVKSIARERCIEHRSKHEYNGFVPARDFPAFRSNELYV